MKQLPAILAGLFTLLLCLLLPIFETRFAFFTAVSSQTYDSILKRTAIPPRSDAIVIIDIDDESLATHGQWPWPRYKLARLTRRLFEAGATVVAFDVVFAEDDRLSPEQVKQVWSEGFETKLHLPSEIAAKRGFDEEFASALELGKSVLGCNLEHCEVIADVQPDDSCYRGRFVELGRRSAASPILQASSVLNPIGVLCAASAGVGFINTTKDIDGVIRRTPLVVACGAKRIYPALWLEALAQHLDVQTIALQYDDSGYVKHARLRDMVVSTDPAGRLPINFRCTRFPHLSASAVLAGSGISIVSNRIAMVGTSAAGLRDDRATPVLREMPGIEIQASAIDNVLSGDSLREPTWMIVARPAIIALLGGILIVMASRYRALVALMAAATMIAMVIAASVWLLTERHLVASPGNIVVSLMLTYSSVTIVKYWQEERGRRWIRNLFGAMVSSEVLCYLEDHPESLAGTGVKTEATMFFSDIADFTTLSEQLDPQRLSDFMHRYLTPMTETIMASSGYVDKFDGDAIMAVWGVPYSTPDHGRKACLCALEQQTRIAELRPMLLEEFGFDLQVRMGINSGNVTAGNMGSVQRRQYTVLGDAVNQAARFQSINRHYGTSIIVGEPTLKMSGSIFETRCLDLIRVKGKTHSVLIYEILGLKKETPNPLIDAARLYEEGLRLHWNREWDDALDCLKRVLAIRPGDLAAIRLAERIVGFRTRPPDEDWQGEFISLHK